MPRIPNLMLENVSYLYETDEDAQLGTKTGGTGFWIGVQSEEFPERSDVYGVTCKHVVKPKDPKGCISGEWQRGRIGRKKRDGLQCAQNEKN